MAKVSKKLVVESGEVFKGALSELDKARREYDNDEWASHGDLYEDEIIFEATGARLSNYIDPKDKKGNIDKDKRPYAYLEFFNDEDKEVLKVSLSFPFKADNILVRPNHKLFDIVANLTGDSKSKYFKVDYEVLQETIASIKSAKIKFERYENDKETFEWFVPVPVEDIILE